MIRWLCLFLFLFSGCNLKPNYSRPEMELGQSFRFERDDLTAYANLPWWEQFKDPEMGRLIQLALDNNQDLQVATGRVLEFYAKYKEVFSQFFPEINAYGSFNRDKLSYDINFFPPVPGVPRINNIYTFLFHLSYQFDFWGKIRNSAEAAKSIYLSQVYARRNVIVTLVSSVAASYILLKQYYKQLEISKLTYESRAESLHIAKLRFEGGIVSDLEVKQAASEAFAAEVQIKNFETYIAKQEDLLSVLLGEAPRAIAQGALLSELALPPSIPAGLPTDLLANRPDILQAEEQIFAANAAVGVARAAFFPSFSLTGFLGQRTTEAQDFFAGSANFFDLGFQVFEPLFTGWRITNQLNEKEALLFQALHSYQQTILTALREVDDALIEHEKAQEKFRIQVEREAALQDYLRLANLRYFNGQSDYLTVLDAEKSLFLTQLDKANTEGDLFLSLVHLYKSLGQGWSVENECELP